jgi:hypothetical protein
MKHLIMSIFFNTRTASVVIIGVLLFSLGCRKDVEEIRPYPVTLDDLAVLLQQVPSPAAATSFTFHRLSQDTTLTTPSGMRIRLTDVDQLFGRSNGLAPFACSTCDNLSILTTAVSTKGDILSSGLPTYSGDGALLESVGMFQLRVFCGTEELQLLPGRSVSVQLPSQSAKSDLMVYAVSGGANEFEGWQDSGQSVDTIQWPVQGGAVVQHGYEFPIAQLGWSNCAKPLSSAGTTSFSVTMKSGYTGLNTQVFLVFDHLLSVVPLVFDDSTRSFIFPKVPAGHPVRVVSVAKLDTAYWLGSTATETGTHTVIPLFPMQQTAYEVLDYLQGL